MREAAERWASESDMLAAFARRAEDYGFVVHPESCGHDLVLRAGPGAPDHGTGDLVEGDVVAVEGKLHPNVAVLAQALPPWARFYDPTTKTRSADFYAVVVPRVDHEFVNLARALGIVAFRAAPGDDAKTNDFRQPTSRWYFPAEARCLGLEALDLPPPVRMRAGAPSPRSVTPWKVAAVRLCLLGLGRELRSADFVGTPVRSTLFVQRGWMREVAREGRRAVYTLVPDATGRPDLAYPEIVAALLEEGAAR